MAKRKLTLVQKEYQKNRKRVQSYIREFRNIGYEVDENILPSIPKKITQASVRRLQKITKKVFREKLTEFIDYETGEVLEGKEARKREKEIRKLQREAKRKPKQRVQRIKTLEQPIQPIPQITFVGHLREIIENLPDERWLKGRVVKNVRPIKDMLHEILEENLSEYGTDYVRYLVDNQEKLDDAVYGVTFASDEEPYNRSVSSLLILINYQSPLTDIQSERLSEFGEYSGYNPAYYE